MNDGTFKIGEIAELRNVPAPFEGLNKQECEVVGALEMRYLVDVHGTDAMHPAYLIAYKGSHLAAPPYLLKKRPGQQDSNSVVTWDKCPWSPVLEAA